VRSTFSDMARARAGGDGPICQACQHYLDRKILRDGQKRGMGLYTKTVIVWAGPAPRWQEWEREAMADDLLAWAGSGLPEPAYLTCNYSKHKHVLPWARRSEAGERLPWISTDAGDVRLVRDWPALVWCVAWLWSRGYPKTLIATGSVSAWALSGSDDPATDLAAAGALKSYAHTPLIDLLTYIVTEANRDRLCDTLARRAGEFLRCDVAGAAGGVPARGDPQRRRRSELQESLPEAVVGDVGGAGAARGDDVGRADPVEQLSLL